MLVANCEYSTPGQLDQAAATESPAVARRLVTIPEPVRVNPVRDFLRITDIRFGRGNGRERMRKDVMEPLCMRVIQIFCGLLKGRTRLNEKLPYRSGHRPVTGHSILGEGST